MRIAVSIARRASNLPRSDLSLLFCEKTTLHCAAARLCTTHLSRPFSDLPIFSKCQDASCHEDTKRTYLYLDLSTQRKFRFLYPPKIIEVPEKLGNARLQTILRVRHSFRHGTSRAPYFSGRYCRATRRPGGSYFRDGAPGIMILPRVSKKRMIIPSHAKRRRTNDNEEWKDDEPAPDVACCVVEQR